MALSLELRRIIPRAAGTYFIVRDNSQITELENEAKMRLFFLNVPQGPVNMAVYFAKGDKTGFQSTFGKSTRAMRKAGNFSIDSALDALSAGPICVINLRSFDDTKDTVQIANMNLSANPITKEKATVPYRQVFKTNTFWTPNYNELNKVEPTALLNFSNVGSNDISIFVVRSKNVRNVTSEGNLTLANCSMEIDEYPALDFEMLVRDTIVDVYVFNNKFTLESGVTTNRYYGHLFNAEGNLNLERINELTAIPEAGFVSMYTGSVIPDLKSETGQNISINTVINHYFMETGLICDINENVFETELNKENPVLSSSGFVAYDVAGKLKTDVSKQLLSHILPKQLTKKEVAKFPPVTLEDNKAPDANTQIIDYAIKHGATDSDLVFETSFEQGIRVGDFIQGVEGFVQVESIETISENTGKTASFEGYTHVKCTCSGKVKFTGQKITKYVDFLMSSDVKPVSLAGCKARKEQFINGTASRQNEILDMMLDPGIVKGIIGLRGIRYVIDSFKSYVEAGYKNQYGKLIHELDSSNVFCRGIINEPFIEDLIESTNPLFKQTPTGPFDSSYFETGGNKNFSSKTLSKFTTGAELCFFFGPGEHVNNVLMGLAGKISNLFYNKNNGFDIVANTTGKIEGVNELEYRFDDNDRMYCEHFRWNPIINIGSNVVIYGNNTGQQKLSAFTQIQNSELVCDIKQNLFNLSKKEAFSKGSYDNYLRTEAEAKSYMEALVNAGAIDPKPVVICNASNNTAEIRKQRIKLVHIEFTPVDAIEKVVFDLTVN